MKSLNYSQKLERKIRIVTTTFIILLLLSGLTAFPIESELAVLSDSMGSNSLFGSWITKCYLAVKNSNEAYPFLAYGTDWLAFAHIVIAIAFIGPMKDAVRNIWIYQFGMIACGLIIPLAFIMGPIRGIPFFWQLIDCSFGILGFIPLYLCYNWTRKLERRSGKMILLG